MNRLQTIALQWLDAFNQHNLEKLLALYDEQAAHYSPKLKMLQPATNGLIKGKVALRAWWEDAFQRLPFLHYHLLHLMVDEEQVFLEYLRQTPQEADLNVGEVLIIRGDKIVASRVYHS